MCCWNDCVPHISCHSNKMHGLLSDVEHAPSAVCFISGHVTAWLVCQWDRLLFLTRLLLPGQAMMTPNMQGVIMAIGKSGSVYEKNGPEAAFFQVHTVSPSPLPVLISHSHEKSFVRGLFMVLFVFVAPLKRTLSLFPNSWSRKERAQIAVGSKSICIQACATLVVPSSVHNFQCSTLTFAKWLLIFPFHFQKVNWGSIIDEPPCHA